MNVLIACEFSGIVRDEFRKLGHNAWSCDLLPCEGDSQYHLQGDVRKVLKALPWDLLIAFPPCTHVCSSGARWFKYKVKEQEEAIEFFKELLTSKQVEKKAIENPIGVLSTKVKKPTQIIQPWMFGHMETKSTCLWLVGLPKLKPTRVMKTRNRNLTPSGQNKLGPSPTRWKDRSRTYRGIARAMAQQWGGKLDLDPKV